ncbi:alpha/beta fold hydrolase [Terribacillus sp. 179-K 1B1 HS]|uniref:alpha/beta hydrolase n=1 Tax=Terribacillus sp. 179-K 1B1 HS TaxID=3142388 RepID=UPI0039A26CE9
MTGILCIHGFTGGTYEVEPLTEHLMNHADWIVELVALPGHGTTQELSLHEVGHKEWIKAAEEAYERLARECSHIYVIGFSMGGMIASHLAAKYGADKLVLLSASGKFLNWKLLTQEAWQYMKRHMSGDIVEDYNKLRKEKKGKVPFRAFLEFKKCVDYTKKSLPAVSCPVFIVQGIQDSMVPHRTVKYLHKHLGSENQKMVLFDESRHLICHGPDIDQICSQVEEFLLEA